MTFNDWVLRSFELTGDDKLVWKEGTRWAGKEIIRKQHSYEGEYHTLEEIKDILRTESPEAKKIQEFKDIQKSGEFVFVTKNPDSGEYHLKIRRCYVDFGFKKHRPHFKRFLHIKTEEEAWWKLLKYTTTKEKVI